jgi:hypothetical protein
VRIRKASALLLTLVIAISFAMPVFATGYGPGTIPDETPFTPNLPTPDRPAPATNSQVSEAVQQALANVSDDGAAVAVLENVSRANANVLKSAFRNAEKAGVEGLTIELDTVTADGKTLSKITINAEIAAKLKGSVDFTVKLSGSEVSRASSVVERNFTNDFAVVALGQKGAFGADIPMAVAVDLGDLDTDNLLFYAFRQNSSVYTEVDTDYEIDEDGFLHFVTPVGGNIVITDSPLASRR